MDEWLSAFRHWETEEEEFHNFAQTLYNEFVNWTTKEEDYIQFATQFLQERFPNLPITLIRNIYSYVWSYQKQ